MKCPTCGVDAPAEPCLGVVVYDNPPCFEFGGARVDLTRNQAVMLSKLATTGSASFEELEGKSGRGALRVNLTILRRRLPAELRIETIPNWGYKLVVGS